MLTMAKKNADKAKTKYVARKVVAKTNLLSEDGTRRLTITLREGAGSAVNIAATIRSTDKDEEFDAQTGARGTFTDVEEGKKALAKLVKDAEGKGWAVETSSTRGSFDSIPSGKKTK